MNFTAEQVEYINRLPPSIISRRIALTCIFDPEKRKEFWEQVKDRKEGHCPKWKKWFTNNFEEFKDYELRK